jgi:predicted RNase H-like nuclease
LADDSGRAIGVDGVRDRWVAVELVDGRFGRAFVVDRLLGLQSVEAEWIGVDVPIRPSDDGWRRADLGGRRLLGARGSSLFLTPPRPVLDQPTFADALALARDLLDGVGISRQAYALFPKILEGRPLAPRTRGSSRFTPSSHSEN